MEHCLIYNLILLNIPTQQNDRHRWIIIVFWLECLYQRFITLFEQLGSYGSQCRNYNPSFIENVVSLNFNISKQFCPQLCVSITDQGNNLIHDRGNRDREGQQMWLISKRQSISHHILVSKAIDNGIIESNKLQQLLLLIHKLNVPVDQAPQTTMIDDEREMSSKQIKAIFSQLLQ